MAMDCEFPEDWEAVAFEEEVAVDDFEEEPLQEPPELPEGLIEELEEELQEEVLLEALPAEEVDDEELAALEAAACARWEAEGAGEVEATVKQAVQRDAKSTGPRNLHKEPWKANWAGNRSHDKGKDKGKGNKQKNKNKAWEAFQQRVQAQVRETWPTPRPPPVARGAWIRPPAKGGHLKGAKGGKFPLRGQRVWQEREKGGKGSAGFRAQPRPELSARQAGHQVQPKVAGLPRRVDRLGPELGTARRPEAALRLQRRRREARQAGGAGAAARLGVGAAAKGAQGADCQGEAQGLRGGEGAAAGRAGRQAEAHGAAAAGGGGAGGRRGAAAGPARARPREQPVRLCDWKPRASGSQ
ncbi:unnamed protein product, partial [Effrenium voratum]